MTDKYYTPEGFAAEIFNNRYTLHDGESFHDACDRVANHVASCETDVQKWRGEFSELLKKNLMMPGGRIWYGSGRPSGNLLNCFVIATSDSREGWGKTASDMIVITGTGGGLGVNFSPIRPRGTEISGHKGKATGAVSLMEIIDSAGAVIKAGGGRRTALMFCLNLTHGDIVEFLDKKLDLHQLNNANVSVWFDENPENFFDKVKRGEDFELKHQDRVIGKVSAKAIWDKIIGNALKNGEPGMLNGYLGNKMSGIWYKYPLVSTNPCFAPGTLVHTKDGHFPIENLVGKNVQVWDGLSWVPCDNFRVTGENQPILKVTMQDGSEIKVTPYHSFILTDGKRVKAQDLQPGMKLKRSDAPLTHGTVIEPGAYLKGFMVGDGTKDGKDTPLLYLYGPKYVCEDRLKSSTEELPVNADYFRSDTNVSFTEESRGRKTMRGLNARRDDLLDWVGTFRDRLPAKAFEWDLKSKCDFIAGVFDADGTASDTKNGWLYQVSSVHREWLLDLQSLLKTIGVVSKLSLMKKAGLVDFRHRGGVCEVQNCWRLTISQSASIVLARTVNFSRLVSFAHKETTYNLKPRSNKIVSIESSDTEEKVYCCTVPSTHSLALTSGFHYGQCGEIMMGADDCCCLGALVLPRFISSGHRYDIDWGLLRKTVNDSVRFLDNVISVNNYPLPQIKAMCNEIRRIGLGVTGLHDMLLTLGYKYNSTEGLELVNKLMNFIKNVAYEASADLAREKGVFPAFVSDLYLKGGFAKTLKPSLRAKIKEQGIRNCALLTIAPTGTTSIVCDVTSGIEPMFSAAHIRRYRDKDDVFQSEMIIHPLFSKFLAEGKDISHFQGSHDLSMRDHFEMQRVCQRHIDNAVSKTVNVPQGTSAEELSDLYMEFFPDLKGVTVYPEGSRDNQPLTPVSLPEAIAAARGDTRVLRSYSSDSCKDGKCDI